MTKEQRFFRALENVFIGAKVEGQGGFINLMRIKSNYYEKIKDYLEKDINAAINDHFPSFRDELFDKLYSFFNRYFTESGSIYFSSTPFHNNVYEKIYTNEKDVVLFWKTQMLYYVKTDRIFRSLQIEVDERSFYFDTSKIETKKANEKRTLVYELGEDREDAMVTLNVGYSKNSTKTDQPKLIKAIKKKGIQDAEGLRDIQITEDQLERAIRIFEQQSEVDFFINKNAREFLQEQFKLWSYQYFWDGAKEWTEVRVNQLQVLKDIAFKTIDFVAQFEDELLKIWHKPKFVKNANYVITLDRIPDKKLIQQIKQHKNYALQIKEWEDLGIDKDNPKAPIDTKHFKDLELEILSQFEDLDKSLDGWLIKSENYQALKTILPKFKEKVQTVYIDPPYSTKANGYFYKDNYANSTWLTMIAGRVALIEQLMHQDALFFISLDETMIKEGRLVLGDLFKHHLRDIAWNTGDAAFIGRDTFNNFMRQLEYILLYGKNADTTKMNRLFRMINPEKLGHKPTAAPEVIGSTEKENYTYHNLDPARVKINIEELRRVGNIWNDIYSHRYSFVTYDEGYGFKTQKPERLLRRIILSSSDQRELVLDCFAGSGTTAAVAHKLKRKWIICDLDESIGNRYQVYNKEEKKYIQRIGCLGRMKGVLAGTAKIEPTSFSKEVGWQGGGFFKYYELEQYEEALAKCKYKDGDLLKSPSRTPYQEYVFMKDEKLLDALAIDYEQNKVRVNLDALYPNIDIAETLSHLTGKWIKKISVNEVEFEDGEKVDIKNLDYKRIKPLIWWK